MSAVCTLCDAVPRTGFMTASNPIESAKAQGKVMDRLSALDDDEQEEVCGPQSRVQRI